MFICRTVWPHLNSQTPHEPCGDCHQLPQKLAHVRAKATPDEHRSDGQYHSRPYRLARRGRGSAPSCHRHGEKPRCDRAEPLALNANPSWPSQAGLPSPRGRNTGGPLKHGVFNPSAILAFLQSGEHTLCAACHLCFFNHRRRLLVILFSERSSSTTNSARRAEGSTPSLNGKWHSAQDLAVSIARA